MMSLNRALDPALPNTTWPDNRVWVPAIDVVEQKDSYLMYAELPGVDPSQIEITFEQNVLTGRGTKQSTVQASNDGEVRAESRTPAQLPSGRPGEISNN